MGRLPAFIVVVFFLLTGCMATREINTHGCWPPITQHDSVIFFDSITIPIPYDTIYLSTISPAKSDVSIGYLSSTSGNDSLTITASITGKHVIGHIDAKDTFFWRHDSLRVFFDYHDVRSSLTLPVGIAKDTYEVKHLVLNLPSNKKVIFVDR